MIVKMFFSYKKVFTLNIPVSTQQCPDQEVRLDFETPDNSWTKARWTGVVKHHTPRGGEPTVPHNPGKRILL